MARFTLTFETDNAAFDDGNLHAEIARILREAASRVIVGGEHGIVYDINGNRVGKFAYEDE